LRVAALTRRDQWRWQSLLDFIDVGALLEEQFDQARVAGPACDHEILRRDAVRAALDEQFNDLTLASLDGFAERPGGIDTGALGKQQLHNRHFPGLDGELKRRGALAGLARVRVRAFGEQEA